MTKIRIPLMGSVTARSNDITKDQHFINCYPASTRNPETEEKRLFVKKRVGSVFQFESSTTPSTGRGLYYWHQTGYFYAVCGTSLFYANETTLPVELITGLDTQEDRVGFTEYQAADIGLFFCDGVRGWTITDANVATQITDVDFPTRHLPSPIFMDGYIFLLGEDGHLYNSDLQDPTSWDALNFLTPEMYPDKAIYLSRQVNQIIAVGSSSVEFFYDAANATGSPLARTSQATLQTGSYYLNSVTSTDGLVMFVASSKSGGHFVAAVESLKMKQVSDEPINRILQEYKNTLGANTDFNAAFIRADGHFFYVLNIRNGSTDVVVRTLVYDITEKLWHEWSGIDIFLSTDKLGEAYYQDRVDGSVFKLSATVYTDAGTTFPVTIQTNIYDSGGYERKFCRKLHLVGDYYSTDNSVDISWSDTDYQTFTAARTVNLKNRPILTQCGAFRRRAFKIYQNNDMPLRLEFIEVDVEVGTH